MPEPEQVDISTLGAHGLASYRADLWLMSPSCQPYTVLNPLAKGAEDPRAKSFIHIVEDVLPRLASSGSHPRCMLIENVAGSEVLCLLRPACGKPETISTRLLALDSDS